MPEPAPPVAEDRLALTSAGLLPSPSYPAGRQPQLFPFRGGCSFISPIRPVRSIRTRSDSLVALLVRVRSSPLSARLKAVIFAYHKLHSRLLAHDSRNKRPWPDGPGKGGRGGLITVHYVTHDGPKWSPFGLWGGVMRSISESLSAPKRFKVFGLSSGSRATSLEVIEGRDTALARVWVMEDSVIEHDARQIPNYQLVGSDITGRAVFARGRERLEVFTANRRPLEEVFGVDLIYLNVTRENIVMVQYKMLERTWNDSEDKADLIYRPDTSLDSEIERMKRFSTDHAPREFDYRLNPGVFYLKFVKRDGLLTDGSAVIPLDHFELLRKDPACRGLKNDVADRSLNLGIEVSMWQIVHSICGKKDFFLPNPLVYLT